MDRLGEQPGDDARRIHWVRSLVAREVVVRMPDEVPRDLPSVRLVLDTFLPGARELACTSPAALLDALVEVWLGVGRALLDAGVRVTLVTAPLNDGEATPFRARLTSHTLREALRAGARARWQDRVRARELIVDAEPSIVVACRLPADASKDASVRWVVVSEHLWAPFEQLPPKKLVGVHSHPTGSPDNRSSRRRRELSRWDRARREFASFAALTRDSSRPGPGNFVARRSNGRIHLEAFR